MKKSILLTCVSATALISGANAQHKQPNIIVLTADDLGWNDISSPLATLGQGSKNHQTPNIDKFATESMSFTSAYCQQNSAPTRAALLTGQYANRTHVYNVWGLDRYATKNQEGIHKEEARIIPADQKKESIKSGTTTFAQLLKLAGYETYIFGKVHGFKMTENDANGFSHNFECDKTVKYGGKKESNYFALNTDSTNWIFDNPLYNKFAKPYSKEYIEKNLLPFANGNDPMTLIGKPKHFTDAIADLVIDQLHIADKRKPLCMWVAFHAIHSQIVGREDLYEKYLKRTALDPRHSNYKYAALTEQLDQTVGRILAAIDDPNGDGDHSDSMRDNTVVIFMSDNGGVDGGNHSNAPLRESKGTLYEGGIRTPLMVRFPKIIKAGTVSNEPVHVIDYLPTFVQLANANMPNDGQTRDGESLLPILKGEKKQLNRDKIFWHFPGYMDSRGIPASVINERMGEKRYKYRFCYENNKQELYNLTDDIGEKVNLIDQKPTGENLKIANKLLADLRQWINETKPLPMYYVADGRQVELPLKVN
ncbi:MAG: sulfatase-like hydrolase/transferase [Bacteroidia bacterium]|nr:sulfatase-like hydrolase/transferase [Bacteroidia bacterium]